MAVKSKFPKLRRDLVHLRGTVGSMRYAMSHRDIEALMIERGINIDHFTVRHWVAKYKRMF